VRSIGGGENPVMEPSKDTVERSVQQALKDLEQITEEIRLKLHLGSMEAKDRWNSTLEPKLLEARKRAREAGQASGEFIQEVVAALRAFSKSI